MIHILICDDDRAFALRLRAAVDALLEERRVSAKITVFSSAEEIGAETLASCDAGCLKAECSARAFPIL